MIQFVSTEPVIRCIEDGRQDVSMMQIEAIQDDERLGYILWHKSNGEIEKLWVMPEHRRKGIATQLWNEACKSKVHPTHSQWRTSDGEAWAQTIGGFLPPQLKP